MPSLWLCSSGLSPYVSHSCNFCTRMPPLLSCTYLIRITLYYTYHTRAISVYACPHFCLVLTYRRLPTRAAGALLHASRSDLMIHWFGWHLWFCNFELRTPLHEFLIRAVSGPLALLHLRLHEAGSSCASFRPARSIWTTAGGRCSGFCSTVRPRSAVGFV